MEDLLYYSLTIAICICIAVIPLLSTLRPSTTTIPPPPPPGPSPLLSLLTPLLFLGQTNYTINRILTAARSRYGPIFTLHLLPSRPSIFIADHAAAHRVLIQCGAAFADRPPGSLPLRIFSSCQRNITSAAYGPLWRALRHNLTGKVLHPSRLGRYAAARRTALQGLVAGVERQMRGNDDDGVVVVEGLLHRAMFHVLVTMCFGERVATGDVVADVEKLQREFLTSVLGFQVLDVWPAVTGVLFRRRWEQMMSLRRRQEELFTPLIRACRRAHRDAGGGDDDDDDGMTYVDTLLGLRIPEDEDGDGGGGGGRKLTEGEMVSLCAEFVAVGTDNTATEAQWIMANLVTHPQIQARLRAEILHVTGGSSSTASCIQEQHLPQMAYLRAVVLEGLRRHPPGHFAIPHAATAIADGGVLLEGFRVPRHATLNFPLVTLGLDASVWPDPLRFRPERFLPGGEGADIDLTGGKEVKMIPFGAGRRICPGMALALLHLELFVAGLVVEFQWGQVAGETVEFAEKQELSVVMRRPLRAAVRRCTTNAAN